MVVLEKVKMLLVVLDRKVKVWQCGREEGKVEISSRLRNAKAQGDFISSIFSI